MCCTGTAHVLFTLIVKSISSFGQSWIHGINRVVTESALYRARRVIARVQCIARCLCGIVMLCSLELLTCDWIVCTLTGHITVLSLNQANARCLTRMFTMLTAMKSLIHAIRCLSEGARRASRRCNRSASDRDRSASVRVTFWTCARRGDSHSTELSTSLH